MPPDFQLPWLKLIPAILAFGAAAADLWYERKKKNVNRWRRFGLPSVVIISGVMSVCVVIEDALNAAQQMADAAIEREVSRRKENYLRKDAEKWRHHEKLQLDRMEGRMGDDGATERYLKAQRSVLQRLSSESTAAAAKSVFDSHAERARLREELKRANERLLASYRSRFEPVLFFVQTKFDDWVKEAISRGIHWQTTSADMPAVVIGPPRGWLTPRSASLNDKSVSFQIYQAYVQDGRLDGQLNIVVYFGSETLLQILLTEKTAHLTNQKATRFSFKSFEGEVEDPISNQDFNKALIEALDQVLSFAIIEGAAR